MIIELGKYKEARELLIEPQGSRDTYAIWRLESIWNQGGCLHWGGRDGDVNRVQGWIQSGSKLGMSIETCRTTAEQSKKY